MKDEGKFYYSAKQKKVKMDRGKCISNFAKLESSEIVEYTEMMAGKFIDKKSNFDDAVYLGKGIYHHSEHGC